MFFACVRGYLFFLLSLSSFGIFFVCKSLNINALKNYSFTFLTKTVIIFCCLSSFCHPNARDCTLWVIFAAWRPKSAEIVNFVKKHPISGLICEKSV